jgi:hypothetical protein
MESLTGSPQIWGQVLKYDILFLQVVTGHAEGSAIARMSYFKT